MSVPFVSIIMPCYNAKPHLAAAIESALNQTYANCELIVIDDGSTDGSLDVIERFADRIRFETGPNRGGCTARNRGIELAAGDYVQFLDADDILGANKIEAQLVALQGSPVNSIASCVWCHFVDDWRYAEPMPRPFWKNYPSGTDLLIATWMHGGFFAQHCWLIPRSLIGAVGGWDTTLAADQDGEFFGRILSASGPVVFAPGATAYYRVPHFGSVSVSTSPASLSSRFKSTEAVAGRVLQVANSRLARMAVRDRWQRLAFFLSPHDIGLAAEAAQRAREAEPSSCGMRWGQLMFWIASRMVGTKVALRVRLVAKKFQRRGRSSHIQTNTP